MAPTLPTWWNSLAVSAPPGLRGLWFGLVELEPSGWHVYVAGTDGFDADDETAEWAAAPYAWWPQGRYLSVPDFAHEDFVSALDDVAAAIRDLRPWEDVPVAGVAVGFDDGDFTIVHAS